GTTDSCEQIGGGSRFVDPVGGMLGYSFGAIGHGQGLTTISALPGYPSLCEGTRIHPSATAIAASGKQPEASGSAIPSLRRTERGALDFFLELMPCGWGMPGSTK